MSTIGVRPVAMDDPVAQQLLRELDQDLTRRYGGDDQVHAVASEFVPPDGIFVVLEVDGAPLACGGFRRWDGRTAELKRMYVRPQGRRKGLARHLLEALETAARDAGYERMWLETGLPQHEAIQLYTSAGYERIPAFGQFAGFDDQRCYGKTLD